MAPRIEWRTKGKGQDALLFVRDYGEATDTVMKTWTADAGLITDFLNDMTELDRPVSQLETDVDKRDPKQWGQLVLARGQESGDILAIDPEIYWDEIYYWFRAHGRDPHPMRVGRRA